MVLLVMLVLVFILGFLQLCHAYCYRQQVSTNSMVGSHSVKSHVSDDGSGFSSAGFIYPICADPSKPDRIAIGYSGVQLRVINATTYKNLVKYPVKSHPTVCMFTTDGNKIVVGSQSSLNIFYTDGRSYKSFTTSGKILDLDYNSVNSKIVTCGDSNQKSVKVRTSDLVTSTTLYTFSYTVTACKYSPIDIIVAGDIQGYLRVWKSDQTLLGNDRSTLSISAIEWISNDKFAVVGYNNVGSDSKMEIWDVSSGSLVNTDNIAVSIGQKQVTTIAASISNGQIALGGKSGFIELYQISPPYNKIQSTVFQTSHTTQIRSLAFRANGKSLYGGGCSTIFTQLSSCTSCLVLNCLVCYSSTQCQTCNSGYQRNGFDCVLSSCNQANDYFYNSISAQCQLCSLVGCTNCDSLTVCATCHFGFIITDLGLCKCDTVSQYFLNGNVCQLCNLANCNKCSSLTTCEQCDTANQYFLNYLTDQCQACNIANCLSCQSLTVCALCDSINHYQVNSVTRQCQCNSDNNYFLNALGNCQLCSVSNCIICSSLSSCQTCDISKHFIRDILNLCRCNQASNYFMTPLLTCQLCSIFGCKTCQDLMNCLTCQPGYDIMPDFTCKKCNFTCKCGGFYPNTNGPLCQTICGDSLIADGVQQCDDGNSNDLDGCSSTCAIEQGFECSNQPSSCLYTKPIVPVMKTILKKPGKNSIVITIQVPPTVRAMIQRNQDQNIFNVNAPGINNHPRYTFNPNAPNEIIIEFDYNKTIHNEEGQISFNWGPIPLISNTPFRLSLQLTPENNQPAIYYEDSDYTTQKQISDILFYYEIISYAILGLSMMMNLKLVGIQLFIVLQMAYFSISNIDNLPLPLIPFSQMNTVKGINIAVAPTDSYGIPSRILILGYANPSLLSNFNIMLGVTLLPMLIGTILYIHHTITHNSRTRNWAMRALNEYMIFTVMFSSMNIAFSSTVYLRYNQSLNFGEMIVLCLGCCLILYAFIVLASAKSQHCGQFKTSFRKQFSCRVVCIMCLTYSVFTGLFLAYRNEVEESCIIVFFGGVSYVFYLLINTPYIKVYHNYRTIVCFSSALFSIFITMYYRSMKSALSVEERVQILDPVYISLIFIGLSVAVSALSIVYYSYQFVRQKCSKVKVQNGSSRNNHHSLKQTEVSIQYVNKNTSKRKGSNTAFIEDLE